MEDFAVTCPLVSLTSHLILGSYGRPPRSSPHDFGLGLLPAGAPETFPHGFALAFLLAFGSAKTWQEDFHLSS